MSSFRVFIKCLYSPNLYMTYRDNNISGRYIPDKWERIGDISLSTACFLWKFGLYTSPFLAAIIWRRGYMNTEGALTLTRITLWFGILVGASFCIRSFGRASNPHYRTFLSRLSNADSPSGVADIKKYDFDFNAWPVEFHLPIRTYKRVQQPSRSWLSTLLHTPCQLIGYAVLHTVGIKMMYPGSISLLNIILESSLIEGRRILVVEKNGIRYKLKTPEGSHIDTMFIDHRNSTETKKGNILVITSEGNAGFYENGIMGTAMESGFSVLGWNHPGFGASSGQPYLDEEESAINTVIEFAIQRLGFPPDQIILYGWSIGGYPSSWGAVAYPSIRAVVVDATFDDVLPLALNQMPGLASGIVRITIRTYADLNVARLLLDYQGNIKMIRRSEDEIIALIPGDMETNRGNDLLRKILKRRYPLVVRDDILSTWLAMTTSGQQKLAAEKNVNREMCKRIIDSYIYDHGPGYPLSELGKGMDEDILEQLTIYLAGEYMTDFNSTHCVPLPPVVFQNQVKSFIDN